MNAPSECDGFLVKQNIETKYELNGKYPFQLILLSLNQSSTSITPLMSIALISECFCVFALFFHALDLDALETCVPKQWCI